MLIQLEITDTDDTEGTDGGELNIKNTPNILPVGNLKNLINYLDRYHTVQMDHVLKENQDC